MQTIGFKELYKIAMKKINPRKISPFIEAGGVSAAILTESGNVYTGVCIDTASSLGMCAERNAIANMITNGEHKIVKLACCFADGKSGLPCGACREFLMQLDKDSGNIEILVSYETMETLRLRDIIPLWWGEGEFEDGGNNKELPKSIVTIQSPAGDNENRRNDGAFSQRL